MSIAHFRTVVATSIVLIAKLAGAENISFNSPDDSLKIWIEIPKVNSSQVPTWSASFNGSQILTNCRLSIELVSQGDLFSGAKLKGESRNSSNKRIRVLFGKVDFANDDFREMRIELQAPRKGSCHCGFPMLQRCGCSSVRNKQWNETKDCYCR